MDNVTIPTTPPEQVVPELNDARLWIACPAYGSKIDLDFATSLMSCFAQLECVGDLQFGGGDSLVSRARNNLAAMFLHGRVRKVMLDGKIEERLVKFDWLLFLDTDLIFKPDDVKMLYELALRKGPGVYAGTYPLKTIKPKIVFNPRPNSKVDENGVVSVQEAGTGFMMIHRSVFLQMTKAYPENDFLSDNGDGFAAGMTLKHDFFQVGVYRENGKHPRYLSEDWFFCRKWIDMGGDIYMQTRICANHIGMIAYPLNPDDIMEVAKVYEKTLLRKQNEKAEAEKKVAEAA